MAATIPLIAAATAVVPVRPDGGPGASAVMDLFAVTRQDTELPGDQGSFSMRPSARSNR